MLKGRVVCCGLVIVLLTLLSLTQKQREERWCKVMAEEVSGGLLQVNVLRVGVDRSEGSQTIE